MAGIQYNGAIKVIANENINIPEPGILVLINGAAGVTSYSGGKGVPVVTGLTPTMLEQLKAQNISGGDVAYLTDSATGNQYILQVEYIDGDNLFFSPTTGFPVGDFINGIEIEFYRGNYSPTNGTAWEYTGAGNSDGYSLYCSETATLKVLTVNNDLIDIAYPDKEPLDLLVVKVLEIVSAEGSPTITALKVQQ